MAAASETENDHPQWVVMENCRRPCVNEIFFPIFFRFYYIFVGGCAGTTNEAEAESEAIAVSEQPLKF